MKSVSEYLPLRSREGAPGIRTRWHGAHPLETIRAGLMQTRDLKEAADLLVEASELLARSGQVQLAAEVRDIVERLELFIPKSALP